MAVAAPGVRTPRCWLRINGTTLPCISATVNRRSQRSADTFNAELSITATSLFGVTLADWADFQPADATMIFATAADGSDQTEMLTGTIDEPDIDFTGLKVAVSARDKSVKLADKRRNEKFPNQKSSEIVTKVAKDHGLTPFLEDTGDFAGKTFDTDTAFLALNHTDFEILSSLAEREGFRWFVDGTTLVFGKGTQSTGTYAATWHGPQGPGRAYQTGDVLKLRGRRNMTAAKPHQVTVSSWHQHQKKLFTATAKLDGVGDPVTYSHHHAGKTQAQVQKLADARLKNATRHELGVNLEMLGDLGIDVRQQLALEAGGTIFGQTYDIDAIDFDIGWGKAFLMDIQAKSAKAGRS